MMKKEAKKHFFTVREFRQESLTKFGQWKISQEYWVSLWVVETRWFKIPSTSKDVIGTKKRSAIFREDPS